MAMTLASQLLGTISKLAFWHKESNWYNIFKLINEIKWYVVQNQGPHYKSLFRNYMTDWVDPMVVKAFTI